MERSRLSLHEWVVVVGVGALFLTFAGISCKFSESGGQLFSSGPSPLLSKERTSKKKALTIWVDGAVEKKGEVHVRSGTRMCDLSGLVRFREKADLECLKDRTILREGQVVFVPQKREN